MTTSDAASPSETRIVEIVFPSQTNHNGTLFGGGALRLMDMAAFLTASRHARRPVVTVGSERLRGKRELCTKGSFVLVAVDEHGRPAPIGPAEHD
jgi:acyl-CoA hydrolase